MPLGTSFGPGTIYDELGRYAKMAVVPGVTVGSLVYASCRDLYSAATFALATQVISANTELDFYLVGSGKQGQGWTGALTPTQTNFTGDKGQMPANQVYVMTHLGFSFASASFTDPGTASTSCFVNPIQSIDAMNLLIEAFTVQVNIGRGTNRIIGKIADFPQCSMGWAVWADNAGSGTATPQTNWASCAANGEPEGLTKLPIPIVFPPLVDVAIRAVSGAAVSVATTDLEANARIHVMAHAHGFEMTMPVA